MNRHQEFSKHGSSGHPYKPRTEKESFNVNRPKFDPKWITEGIDMEALDKLSSFAKELKNFIKTTKLRKFYGEVKRIQVKGISDSGEKIAFRMLKPKLAYAVGREKGDEERALRVLNEFLVEGLNLVDTSFGNPEKEKIYYVNFVNLFEAIIAYHKYHGGRDK